MNIPFTKTKISGGVIIAFIGGVVFAKFLLPKITSHAFANIPDKCTDDPGVPHPGSGTPGWYWVTRSGCNTHHHCTVGQTFPGATCQQTSGGGHGGGGGGYHGGGGGHGGHKGGG